VESDPEPWDPEEFVPEPPPPEPPPPEPPGCTESLGFPPPAVGNTSTY
jgi:hypothetical protein